MELQEYIRVLLRRKWIVIQAFVIVSLSAYLFAIYSPWQPIYKATTTILISSEGVQSSLDRSIIPGINLNKQVNTAELIEIIKTRTVIGEVVKRLGLDESHIDEITENIDIVPVRSGNTDTGILRISAKSLDPREAKLITDTIAQIIIDENREARQVDVKSARIFLEKQLSDTEKALHQAEANLLQFKQANEMVSMETKTSMMINKLSQFEADLATTKMSLEQLNIKRDKISAELSKQSKLLASSGAESPMIQQLRSKLTTSEIQLASLLNKVTEKHPDVTRVRAEIDAIKKQIQKELTQGSKTVSSTLNPIHQDLFLQLIDIDTEVMALQAKEKALEAIVSQYESKVNDLPTEELQITRLNRELSTVEKTYMLLLERLEDMHIAEAMEVGNIRVIDPAIEPEEPINPPRRNLKALFGALVGLVMGIGLAFFFEYLDNTIKSVEDVNKYLEAPVLGVIPLVPVSQLKVKERKRRRPLKKIVTLIILLIILIFLAFLNLSSFAKII